MNVQQRQEIIAQNENAFRILVRAITLSQGTFSLILVRCNYPELAQKVYQRLNEICSDTIEEIVLPPSSKTLYTAIKQQLGDRHPAALMVFGLDSVVAIDDLLAATNQVRDSFCKHFTFPLVLWCNDNILRKFRQLAPDFYSWTSVPIHFGLDTEELVQRLHQVTNTLFSKAMEIGAGRFPHSSALYLSPQFCPQQELKATLADLSKRGHQLEPILEASLKFIWGLDNHANNRMQQAKNWYIKSLKLLVKHQLPPSHPDYQLRIERLSCVLFYSGLWWRRYAVLHREHYTLACEQARECYRRCIKLLQQYDRPKLVAKFIVALGEVLHRLEEWKELSTVAQTAINLQKEYFDPIRLAYSYGLLAEVALVDQDWDQAKQYAEEALKVNHQNPLSTEQAQRQQQELCWAQPHYQSLYLLLLAEAQWHLSLTQAAIENLEKAKSHCKPGYDPLLYIRILKTLRQRYFDQGEYLKAFRTKQQQRSIGQQYRLQAFVGAGRLRPEHQIVTPALSPSDDPNLSDTDRNPKNIVTVAQEISASGRENDLENLMKRIRDKQYKLTILHGQSGVGKSSIVNAGLVPALMKSPIEARNVIPIVLRTYSNWCQELGEQLTSGLKNPNVQLLSPLIKPAFYPKDLIKQLEYNEQHSLQTVIIFDQFEEFFFNCSQPEQRKAFFEFFKRCLDLAYVKIILALREDYLHYLLACDNFQLDAINNDILGRHNRYSLGNLSVANTKLLIQRLTSSSQFIPEDALIDRLTADLAQGSDEVRPIELQVVGMQLQEENITTLEQYQKLGKNPKQKLIERFLEQVIKDCGRENKEITNLVLYLLTDEKGTRPMKTKDELRSNLSKLLPDHGESDQQLELILKILEESGLVLVLLFRETPVLQEVPPPRFQLVHDYLVELIRQRQKPALLKEVEKLRKQNELLEAQAREDKLKAELTIQQEQRKRADEQRQHAETQLRRAQRQRRQIKKFSGVIGILAATALGLAITAWIQRQQAQLSQLQAMESESIALLSSGKKLEALAVSIRLGNKITQQRQRGENRLKIIGQFFNVVYNIKEFNRLEGGHSSWVNDVSFSPDGTLIASASADNTVRVWKETGELLPTTLKHEGRVNSVRFSPDGNMIATASADTTIKLWDRDGRELKTLKAHEGSINSTSFSPDGKILVSASDDKQIILWDLETYEPITTINSTDGDKAGHRSQVKSVSFNPDPDAKTFVTASWDNTVKLWNYDGTLVRTLVDTELSSAETEISHADKVSTVSFSPDGGLIASAGLDNKIKLWHHDGTLVQTLDGHKDIITSLAFNHNGQILLSTGADNTLKLWELSPETTYLDAGNIIENIAAISVRFLNSEDNVFAVAGENNDVRLFRLDGMKPPPWQEHEALVNSVDFTPDGKTVVSAGDIANANQAGPSPGSIILWNLDGIKQRKIKSLGRVLSLSVSRNGQHIASIEESIDASLNSNSLLEERNFLSPVTRKVIVRNLEGKKLDELVLQKKGETNKIEVKSISFSFDNRYIAIAQDVIINNNTQGTQDGSTIVPRNGRLTLWEPSKQQPPPSFATGDSPITDIQFHPSKSTLATAHDNGTIALWTTEGNQIHKWQAHDNKITSLRFSPDGQHIASGSQDTTIKIWDLAGTERQELKGHTGTITSIDFQGNDGKAIATASVNGNIRLWNIESGESLANFQSSKKTVNGIKFSPGGKTIAAATDKTVILWNLDLDNYLLKRSCNWLKDYLANNPNVQDNERQLCSRS